MAQSKQPEIPTQPQGDTPSLFTFDYAEFASHLDDVDASDAEKEELLRIVWIGIVVPLVQIKHGVHPVDQMLDAQAQTACGSKSETGDPSPSQTLGMVEYVPKVLAARFGAAAADKMNGGAP